MAETETPQVEAPEASAPQVDPTAAARQHIAEQQLSAIQNQLNGVTNQLGAVTNELVRRQNNDVEAEMAMLPAAERAERKADIARQQLAYVQQQISRQQAGAAQETQQQYFQRRSKELETEINSANGLDGERRLKITEVPEEILAAGERPTAAWLRAEAENRKTLADRKAKDTAEQADDSVGSQVRRALADAGVSGPIGARPASTAPVAAEDYQKLMNREQSPRDFPQGKKMAALREMRERAYQQAGLAAPGR